MRRGLLGNSLLISIYFFFLGIWDCLSSQQVVDFTRRAIADGDSLTRIAENMMEKCLAPDSELGGVGCDNMTVVVVAVLNGKTEEEWAAWVKKRVEDQVCVQDEVESVLSAGVPLCNSTG